MISREKLKEARQNIIEDLGKEILHDVQEQQISRLRADPDCDPNAAGFHLGSVPPVAVVKWLRCMAEDRDYILDVHPDTRNVSAILTLKDK